MIANYTDYLLDNAKHAPIEIAVVSFLPCFMIYRELGKRLDLTTCALNHPYRKWMASYSSENFIAATKTITQMTQELTEPIMCPLQQEKLFHLLQNQRSLNGCSLKQSSLNKKSIQLFTTVILLFVVNGVEKYFPQSTMRVGLTIELIYENNHCCYVGPR
ncbi:thiaminase II/PqqC family protein [Legionella tunisiensis]|uniref:hypothetical protein n=1 Tax=Legionella tunisiensis TaxID=1034944 RepID=UPI0018DE0180|nr:hypothetical protein [Legionella tunisiensis]